MTVARIRRNFSVASADTVKSAEFILNDRSLASLLSDGLELDDPIISYACKTEFPDDFLRISYSEDESESLGRYAIPLFLFFAAAWRLLPPFCFIKRHADVTVFCVAVCITAR